MSLKAESEVINKLIPVIGRVGEQLVRQTQSANKEIAVPAVALIKRLNEDMAVMSSMLERKEQFIVIFPVVRRLADVLTASVNGDPDLRQSVADLVQTIEKQKLPPVPVRPLKFAKKERRQTGNRQGRPSLALTGDTPTIISLG